MKVSIEMNQIKKLHLRVCGYIILVDLVYYGKRCLGTRVGLESYFIFFKKSMFFDLTTFPFPNFK